MPTIRPHEYDHDAWDEGDEGDEGDEAPAFERVRKQTGKAATVKGDRRQQEKEWGRAISKHLKQRARESQKP
jgi:hypothetical protein